MRKFCCAFFALLVMACASECRQAPISLSGIVVDERGGPMFGAKVFAAEWGRGNLSFPFVTTARDGSYDLRSAVHETSNVGWIAIFREGFGARFCQGGELTKPLRICLTPERKMPLRFVSPDGKPAAGLIVSITRVAITDPEGKPKWSFPLEGELEDFFTAKTDSEGIAHIPGLCGGCRVSPTLLSGTYVQLDRKAEYPVEGKQAASIQLEFGGEIAGTVLAGGFPAAGVLVRATPRERTGSISTTWTSQDGSYHLSNLRKCAYDVSVLPGTPFDAWIGETRPSVSVEPQEVHAGVNFALAPLGSIAVKFQSLDRRPLSGYSVNIVKQAGPENGAWFPYRADRNGWIRASMPAGSYKIVFGDGSAKEVFLTQGRSALVDHDVLQDPDYERLLTGEVVDEKGGPVEGATVRIFPGRANSQGADLVVSDDRGQFKYVVKHPGPNEISAEWNGKMTRDCTLWDVSGPVKLKVEPNVALSVTGRVADERSVGLEGATVTLLSKDRYGSREEAQCKSGAGGSFQFQNVPPGRTLAIQARAAGWCSPSEVEIAAQSGPTLTADILVRRCEASLRGKVVDPAGIPVVAAPVALQGGEAQTVTDEDGNFELKEVPRAEFDVIVGDLHPPRLFHMGDSGAKTVLRLESPPAEKVTFPEPLVP